MLPELLNQIAHTTPTYLFAQQYKAARLDLNAPETQSIVALATSGLATCFAIICIGETRLSLAHTHRVEDQELNPFQQIVNEIKWTQARTVLLYRNPSFWQAPDRQNLFQQYQTTLSTQIHQAGLLTHIEVYDVPRNHLTILQPPINTNTACVTLFRDGTVDTQTKISTNPIGDLTKKYYHDHFTSLKTLEQAPVPPIKSAREMYKIADQLYKKGHKLHALKHFEQVYKSFLKEPPERHSATNLSLCAYTIAMLLDKREQYERALDFIQQATHYASQAAQSPPAQHEKNQKLLRELTRKQTQRQRQRQRQTQLDEFYTPRQMVRLDEPTILNQRLEQKTNFTFYSYQSNAHFVSLCAIYPATQENDALLLVEKLRTLGLAEIFTHSLASLNILEIAKTNDPIIGEKLQKFCTDMAHC